MPRSTSEFRWTRALGAAAALLAAAVLAACSGGYGSSGGAASASTATAAAPAATAGSGVTLALAGDPAHLHLVGPTGHALYVYARDTAGTSNCSGGCAQNWPPLEVTGAPSAASGVAGKLGTIARADGDRQVTLDGMPLYYYAGDAQAGQTSGDGVGGVWSLARAMGAGATSAPSSSAGSAGGYGY